MSVPLRIVCFLVIAAGVLAVTQIWYPLFAPAVFVKLMLTFGILIAVAGIVAVVRREAGLRDRGYLE